MHPYFASRLGILSPIRPAGATLALLFAEEGGAAFGLTITPVFVLLSDLVAAAPGGDCPYDGELSEDDGAAVTLLTLPVPILPEFAAAPPTRAEPVPTDPRPLPEGPPPLDEPPPDPPPPWA
jgi:hypothetical protein